MGDESCNSSVKICVLQPSMRADDEHPLQSTERVISFIKDVVSTKQDKIDLFVLPELCPVGYSEDTFAKYLPSNSTMQDMFRQIDSRFQRTATKLNSFICYGTIGWEQKQEKIQYYIRQVVVNAQGEEVAAYDKIHLCDYGDCAETRFFMPGHEIVSFSIPDNRAAGDDFKFGLIICAEKLGTTIKQLESTIVDQREQFLRDTSRLKGDLKLVEIETTNRIQNLERESISLKEMIAELQKEKTDLFQQIVTMKSNLSETQEKLAQSNTSLKDLRESNHAQTITLKEEQGGLTNDNQLLKAKLHKLLENQLLPESEAQLEQALEQLRQHQESASKASEEMPVYEQKIKDLREELKLLSAQKDEERENFQKLNEDSYQAYTFMKENASAKDLEIDRMKLQLADMRNSLEVASKKHHELSLKLTKMNGDVDHRICELTFELKEAKEQSQKLAAEKTSLERMLDEALQQMKKDAAVDEQKLKTQQAQMEQRIAELENELKDTAMERDDAQNRLITFNQREEELYRKLRESDCVRRGLHDKVMQLIGNIRVYVRVRPIMQFEEESTTVPESAVTASENKKKRKRKDSEEKAMFQYPGHFDRSLKRVNSDSDDVTKNLIELIEPYKDRGGLSDRRKNGLSNLTTCSAQITPRNISGRQLNL